jgi:heme oxygenase
VGINVVCTRLPLKKASSMMHMKFEDSRMSLRNFVTIRNYMDVINYIKMF